MTHIDGTKQKILREISWRDIFFYSSSSYIWKNSFLIAFSCANTLRDFPYSLLNAHALRHMCQNIIHSVQNKNTWILLKVQFFQKYSYKVKVSVQAEVPYIFLYMRGLIIWIKTDKMLNPSTTKEPGCRLLLSD